MPLKATPRSPHRTSTRTVSSTLSRGCKRLPFVQMSSAREQNAMRDTVTLSKGIQAGLSALYSSPGRSGIFSSGPSYRRSTPLSTSFVCFSFRLGCRSMIDTKTMDATNAASKRSAYLLTFVTSSMESVGMFTGASLCR